MQPKFFFSSLLLVCISCDSNNANADVRTPAIVKSMWMDSFKTIAAITIPDGYKKGNYSDNSFARWLEQLPLKADKTVFLYNGEKKANQTAQFAVLNITVGNKNLQQCADAVMRLRAEYLFHNQQFEAIKFTDNERKVYQFQPPYSKENFMLFLDKVFAMCGTASLAKELHAKEMKNIEPGDVLIRGGFPGHSVIVIAVASNMSGQKKFMIAQSYMPAQDIHILKNFDDENLSPWYPVTDNEKIYTPEYVFTKRELKGW